MGEPKDKAFKTRPVGQRASQKKRPAQAARMTAPKRIRFGPLYKRLLEAKTLYGSNKPKRVEAPSQKATRVKMGAATRLKEKGL
jgi:hypothetical protein